MAILKIKEIRNMGEEERNKKLKELKFELIISKANSSKILSLKKSKSEELKKN